MPADGMGPAAAFGYQLVLPDPLPGTPIFLAIRRWVLPIDLIEDRTQQAKASNRLHGKLNLAGTRRSGTHLDGRRP
jgi:hypothetical protein